MTKPEKRKVSSVDVELALPKRENIFIPQIDSMPDCNTDQHKFSQDFIDRNSEPLSEIPDADADSQNEKNTKRAKELWSKAQAATGTPVETYLKGRGITGEIPDTLRYHLAAYNHETKTNMPCMIAAVSVFNSQIVAIHRTYLKKNEDGSVTKADVGTPKMLLGPISGGSVQLSLFQEGCRLIIAEGIETALSVLQACPEACVWAVLSASNFHNLTLPPKEDFSDIIIAADHDKAGINAAEKTANKWTQEGYRVKIALPDREGEDFNHVLNEQGVAKVVELIHKAVVVEYKETIEDQLKTLNKGIDESFVLKADGVYHRRKIKGEDERVDVKLCSYLAPTHQIRGDESDPQWSRLMALKDNDGNVYDHILSMGDLAGDGASYRETLFSLGCLKEII